MSKPLYGLPAPARIGGRKRIRELLEKGSYANTRFFFIRYLLTGSGQARVAVVTPKTTGTAVVRNRLRRRMKEVFRQHLPQYRAPFDVLIFPQASAAHCRFIDLTEEFRQCFASQKLL